MIDRLPWHESGSDDKIRDAVGLITKHAYKIAMVLKIWNSLVGKI